MTTVVSPLDGVLGRRVLQALIDRLIIVVTMVVPATISIGFARWQVHHGRSLGATIWPVIGAALLLPVFSCWLEVWLPYRHHGATPGMRMTGLCVVTVSGTTAPLSALFIRWLLLVVDGVFAGLVALVLIAATERKQRLGDIVAGTLVVRTVAVPTHRTVPDVAADAGILDDQTV